MRLQSRCQPGLQSSGGFASKLAYRAVDRRPHFLAVWTTPRGECVYGLVAGTPRARDPREQVGNCSVVFNLVLEVTHCRFHVILPTGQP